MGIIWSIISKFQLEDEDEVEKSTLLEQYASQVLGKE